MSRLSVLFVAILLVPGSTYSQNSAGSTKDHEAGDSQNEPDDARLVLAPPEHGEVGFASWDANATDGQAPSWAYFVTLREKFTDQSWNANAFKAAAVYFFNAGSLRKKLDLPWKPSSIEGWNSADESVSLDIGVGGEHITYRHYILGPMVKGRRMPTTAENKVLDRSGAIVAEGRDVRVVSRSGKFGIGSGSIIELGSGVVHQNNGGYPTFSRFDDSYILTFSGQSGLEYHDASGNVGWSASLGGSTRNVFISPSGGYVFAAAAGDGKTDVMGVIDASGKVLWKVPVLQGVYAAGFSRDGRLLGVVTRDANWLFESATGKVLTSIPMSRLLGDDNEFPINVKVYVTADKPRVLVIARTTKTDKSSQSQAIGNALGGGGDVVYSYGIDSGRILSRLPGKPLILAGAGIFYEPVATLSPDEKWLYYLTTKGLYSRHLE